MKPFLLAGAAYVGSIVLFFVYLVVGAAMAGPTVHGGERGVALVLGLSALTFLAAFVAVLIGTVRGEAPTGLKWGLPIGYAVVSGGTFAMLGLLAIVVFNR